MKFFPISSAASSQASTEYGSQTPMNISFYSVLVSIKITSFFKHNDYNERKLRM